MDGSRMAPERWIVTAAGVSPEDFTTVSVN